MGGFRKQEDRRQGFLLPAATITAGLVGQQLDRPTAECSRGRGHALRRELRQIRSVSILKRIRAWLELCVATELPNGDLVQAAQYAISHLRALSRFVDDGRLSIDNNAAERALRAVAVGRKNWLFYQTEGGGKAAAILLSLVQTAGAIGDRRRSAHLVPCTGTELVLSTVGP